MTIPDEAVHAAKGVLYYANHNDVETALTAALPFLTGVKVDKKPYVDCACTKIQHDESCTVGYPSLLCEICDGKGVVPYVKLDGPELWEIVFGIANEVAHEISDKQYTKIAEAINSVFIEPAPSPRAQALEEAARYHDKEAEYYSTRNGALDGVSFKLVAHFHRLHAAAIRALSSQPVADGWLPIEGEPDNQQGPFLVTNNPKALNAFGRPSHIWCVSGIYKEKDGSFCAFEGTQKIHGLRMFMPVSAPLPASLGASE